MCSPPIFLPFLVLDDGVPLLPAAAAAFPRLLDGVVAGEAAAAFLLLRGWSMMLLRSRSARETIGVIHLPPRSFLMALTYKESSGYQMTKVTLKAIFLPVQG